MSDFTVKARIEGYEEALETLKNLGDERERQKIMRGAIASAGRIVRDTAKPMIPVGKEPRHVPGYGVLPRGSLRNSIRVSTRIERGGNLSQLFGAFGVSGKVIVGNRKKGIYWAHFVELGTRPHSTGRGARLVRKGKFSGGRGQDSGTGHPGTPAYRYMRRAIKSTEDRVSETFIAYVEKRLAALAKTGRGD